MFCTKALWRWQGWRSKYFSHHGNTCVRGMDRGVSWVPFDISCSQFLCCPPNDGRLTLSPYERWATMAPEDMTVYLLYHLYHLWLASPSLMSL